MSTNEISDDEIILLIMKYLHEKGYAKTEKMFKKENTIRNLDYDYIGEMKDLKVLLDDYFRIKESENAKNSICSSLCASMGPEIENTFKSLELLLHDYSQYRKSIENHVGLLSETFKIDSDLQKDTTNDAASLPSLSQASDWNVPDIPLPMDQYLQLYKTLPEILPDMINKSLAENSSINDKVIDSIVDHLQQNSEIGDLLALSDAENRDEAKKPVEEPSPSRRKAQRKGIPQMKENKEEFYLDKRTRRDE